MQRLGWQLLTIEEPPGQPGKAGVANDPTEGLPTEGPLASSESRPALTLFP
jgi:hypothetical protein